MPLISLHTNLKDLQWGKDQRGGGSSDEPYIRSSIPDNFTTNFDEGLIRGGFIGAVKRSITDTSRIFQFFKDVPKGPLFIIKQVGLQLSNPRLETKTNIGLGPTRIYNLGINTLAQIPVNAFGIHLQRHGLVPIQDESTKYESVVKNKSEDNNRLVKLRDRLIVRNEILKLNKKDNKALGRILSQFGTLSSFGSFTSNISNFIKTKIAKQQSIIDRYVGGPGSLNGIGTTTIRRSDYTPAINEEASKYFDEIRKQSRENLTQTNVLVIRASRFSPDLTKINTNNEHSPEFKFFRGQGIGGRSLPDLPLEFTTPIPRGNDVIISKDNYNTEQKLLKDRFYEIDKRIRRGSPGDKSRNRKDYSNGSALDQITALQIFKIENDQDLALSSKLTRDLIKFRFEAIDTDSPNASNVIVFRAFIKGINFPFNPTWNGIKYNGRGEQFYIYDGFTSTISFNFQLAAQSREEMKPMYQKLNYLISNCTPDYRSNRMRGPLMKLTIGNLVYRQPGFISSLSPTVNDDASWEIALDEPERGKDLTMLELPHMIDIACTFTPIYNFLPQKSLDRSPFIADKGSEMGAGSRWIEQTQLVKIKGTDVIPIKETKLK